MAITPSEEKLCFLLKQYPHPGRTGEDYENMIIIIALAGRENGWTEEFIRICEANPNVTLDELFELIHTPERFPALEIVDDDDEDVI